MQVKSRPYIRVLIVSAIVVVLFSSIILRLLNLQVRSGEENVVKAEVAKMKTNTLTGSRGKITDRNGLVLAYDMPSYDLEFYSESNKSSEKIRYTQILLEVIEIVESGRGKMVDNFSIVRNDRGQYEFDFRTQNEEVALKRKNMWISNFGIAKKGEEITAEQAYERLLAMYGIEDLEWEQAKKVLALWEEWLSNAFLAKPVRIARNIDMATVAKIEARQVDLSGVSVLSSTTRIYPRGETAAHTIGYLGAISSEKYDEYVTGKKYAPGDLVGVSGIELFMEDDLTGNSSLRQGTQTVEVNASNRVTRELSYTPATNGNNVVLNIDLQLQIILDQALKATIENARVEQRTKMETATDEKKALYLNTMINRGTTSLNLAQAGAAVVMDVNTGKVLAMSSYPSFNPNDFVGGLSTANYQKYFDSEHSELAKLSPTLNRVIRTKATPGSIFKMVTGLAGVMEGVVDIDTKIDDIGEYNKHVISGKAPKCWLFPHQEYAHRGMTVSTAITNSCNYYFYTVADELGIDRLHDWSSKLGLTSTTGIELSGEVSSVVGKQQVLYDITKEPSKQTVARTRQAVNAVRTQLLNLRTQLDRNYADERIESVLTQLMELSVEPGVDLNSSIRTILMAEMGLTYQEVAGVVGNIQMQISDLRWTANETIMTGIGQSITEITPIGAARYLSALANGGVVNDAKLIDRVLSPDGTLDREIPTVSAPPLEGVEEALAAIKLGMRGVVDVEEGGTAAKYFKDYPYTNYIAGKTGTAQVNLIDIEDNAWFVAYAPFDDPEIAVVVFIANGMSGGYCSPAAQAVFTYYFQSKEGAVGDNNPVDGKWIP